jgi:Protein of unknown function (DUF3309)
MAMQERRRKAITGSDCTIGEVDRATACTSELMFEEMARQAGALQNVANTNSISIQAAINITTTMLLLIILNLLLIGGLPFWPTSRGLGYYPSGIPGTVLLIVVILMLPGRI